MKILWRIAHDVLKRQRAGLKKTETIELMDGYLRCHHCGALRAPWLRPDFVHADRILPIPFALQIPAVPEEAPGC